MNICKDMRFWILTTVSVNIMVFWDVAYVVGKIGTIILPAAAGFTRIPSTRKVDAASSSKTMVLIYHTT
jgi:hypothetical protein